MGGDETKEKINKHKRSGSPCSPVARLWRNIQPEVRFRIYPFFEFLISIPIVLNVVERVCGKLTGTVCEARVEERRVVQHISAINFGAITSDVHVPYKE